LSSAIDKIIGKIVNSVSSVSQSSVENSGKEYPDIPGIRDTCRTLAAEGIVLLKNEGNILPLQDTDKTAFFGRVQNDTFFVGYGSGGDVNAPYKVSYMEAIEKSEIKYDKKISRIYKKFCKKNPVDNGYWGHWPMSYEEMPLSDDIVKISTKTCNKAILFIGRAAGEDRENTLTKGSYYLTDEEENELKLISHYFKDFAVVMNAGNIIDYSFVTRYNVPCLLIAGLGGMEAGNALVDVLTGKQSPSGHLCDTIAIDYSSYPSAENFGGKDKNIYQEDIFVGYRYFNTFCKDKVLFPFGKGLSYTTFYCSNVELSSDDNVSVSIRIKNTGEYDGKYTSMIYCRPPQGKLPKPEIVLCSFSKSPLLTPGASTAIRYSFDKYVFASFDDSGISGHKNCYILEKGEYTFWHGTDCADLTYIGSISVNETEILSELSERCAPVTKFMRYKPMITDSGTALTYELVPTRTTNLREHIEENLPKNGKYINKHLSFEDVLSGNITAKEFASSLSYEDLEAISRGHYTMNSPLGAAGNAGVFGGVTTSLIEKKVPPICCTDGPSGIRLSCTCSLLPTGSTLAQSFNSELITRLYSSVGREMRELDSDMLLAPGMNIHRDPLCGRNFEYFSEDPVVAGLAAAAVVKGLQSSGVSACPKHFACNNQETNRTKNDSIVSQRALREIYLKPFEICIKNAKPLSVMTSYNKINGVWSHYNYELCKDILRDEWGYDGLVITDWWMQSSASPEFPRLKDQAYRVRSHVNVLMPGGKRVGKKVPDGTLLETLDKPDGIRSAEIQDNAEDVLNFIIKLTKGR